MVAASSLAGSSIGDKYVLLEQIGTGGVGVVYRAAQPALSRWVAIKLLHRDLADDPESVRRFHDEARAATRFSHPNSVAVIDTGTSNDGTPFIVMEHVRGDTLRALLKREGWLPLARVISIAQQVLAGLGAAHRAEVVHADIKTDNVLVEPTRDGGERIKIVDFGLAEFARARADRAGSSDDRDDRGELAEVTVSGTPEYMAPEVIRGEPATPAADLYSVGVVVYELLTGTTPFAGGSDNDIMCRHLDDEVVPPSLRRPGSRLPAEIDAVVARALAKDPAARFADAAAFSAALSLVPTAEQIAPFRCDACGQRGPDEARFCICCGTAAGAVAPSAERHVTTKVVTPRPRARLARGSAPVPTLTNAHFQRLRASVGAAIARGDAEQIASAYLALSRALAGGRREPEAIRELQEGIDILTAGATDPRRARSGPACQLVLTLAALEARAGQWSAA